MRHLLTLLYLLWTVSCSTWAVSARPALTQLLIEAAPSVVSYQGSSHTHTRFVIAPMGRSLGYVEPTNVNRTLHKEPKQPTDNGYELLKISPVYVHQH